MLSDNQRTSKYRYLSVLIGTYPPTYTALYLGTGEILTPVAVGSSNLREFNFVLWTTV